MSILPLFLCLGVASAHNWLTSPARANQNDNFNGWTSPPCPQKGERVHVQVAPGQRFPIEWASGHGYGSYTFFVVLKAQDESNMISHTLDSLDAYLKAAPTPALDYMKDTWAMHAIPPNSASPGTSLVSAPVTSTWYAGGRPASFRQYAGTVEVYNKTVTSVQADKRAKYTNPDMPWIISVHKFALHEDRADEMDLAFLEIPSDYPSGQYVVQYLWNGYYDCVDVNALATQSTDVFGNSSTDASLDRIDHCFFNTTLTAAVQNTNCFEIKAGVSPSGCTALCTMMTFNSQNNDNRECHGVQISPVKLPATAKFPGMYRSGTSHLPDTCDVTGFAPTSSVCYMLHVNANPIVGPPYKVVADTEDPVFYSTCYRKKPGWKFAQTCPACVPSVPKLTNKFGYSENSCTTCGDMYANQSPLVTPVWTVSNVCFACDGTLG